MAVFVAPDSKPVRTIELAVLDALTEDTGGRIFDLLGWLEGRIASAKNALA